MSPRQAGLSKWTVPVSLPIVPSSGAVLADGKVLFWAADGRRSFGGGGHTFSALFDPITNTAIERDVADIGHDMFCSGTARLADGRLLVNGGLDAGATSIYDPSNNTWARAATMNIARGYNASATLADGSVLTLGGSWSGGDGNKTAEIYTSKSGWRTLGGVPQDPYLLYGTYMGWQSDSHPALIPTANGKVLVAGPAVDMAWIDTRGNGSSTPAGRRGDDVPSFSGNTVMYEAGKILKVGGAGWNNNEPANARAYVIDTTAGSADVHKLAPMAYPRVFSNSVVLPNGQVLIVGGQTYAQEFSDSNAVLSPELFDPQTGSFTVLPAMSVPRNYHSIAMLLPDARVVSAGGGMCNCDADHPDLQIMSPPYLFNEDGTAATRPVLVDAPTRLSYGGDIAVTTMAAVTSFSLVRLGSITHTVDSGQRRVSLGFSAVDATHYQVSIPGNPGILIPGQWMLFAMDAQGTPSVAKVVTVDGTGAPVLQNPGNTNLTLGQSMSLQTTATTLVGTLDFGATGLPAGLHIDRGTGLISGTPAAPGNFLTTIFVGNKTQTVSTDIVVHVSQIGSGTGLLAQYFATPSLSGPPVLERTEAPNFDWGGSSPAPGVPADRFSTRWSGWIEAPSSGKTGLRTVSDDGVRVWVGDWLVIDNWTDHEPTVDTTTIMMEGGRRYPITVEYMESTGGATLQLQWQLSGDMDYVAVPVERLYPGAPPAVNNIALGQPSSQASTNYGGVSSRAVDGNVNGDFRAVSASESVGATANDWWQVDLGRLNRIDRIVLWNRTDCCSERLANFIVFVSENDMNGRTLDQLRADPAVTSRQVGATRALPNIGIPLGGSGRYVRVQLVGTGVLSLAEVEVFGGPGLYHTPSVDPIADQQGLAGSAVSLTVKSSDPDSNRLNYSATGLPAGLRIQADTGVISGSVSEPGSYKIGVTASNAGGLSASVAFTWTVLGVVPKVVWLPAPIAASGVNITYTPALSAGMNAEYSWNFGDGTAETAFASGAAVDHRYASPGAYSVTLTIRTGDGRYATERFVQGVSASGPTAAARASSNLLLEARAGGSARLWVVNEDNDSVSVFDTANDTRLAEIPVGSAPRSLALLPDGRIWVVNKRSASISIINPASLSVVQTLALPRASQPFGIVVSPADGSAFITLEAIGQVLQLNAGSGAVLAHVLVGDNPRHLAVTSGGERLLVSRYITPPLPGEGTPLVRTTDANNVRVGGEVVIIDTALMAVTRTVVLGHSEIPDAENQGRGIPNYLGAPAIAPDGMTAWVPSKQDNVLRGLMRDGRDLDFQNTVRAVSSRIDLVKGSEDLASRIDHDNASVASAAIYHPSGVYLFVALETSRQVAVIDSVGRKELFRLDVGLAPQGLAVSADGLRLYVSNLMGRSVSAIDLSPLVNSGKVGATSTSTLGTVASERLSPSVLRGKQLFYDARDPRLARDSYMSCASCHNDGGQDGRTWDLTGLGEGLRNTIPLRGRAGLRHGFLHWSANFDEVQDFEGQIRQLAGGTGLMLDADFNAGSRSQPLGDTKAGLSADLDALAAYIGSLDAFAPSPWRNPDATLTATAQLGKVVFADNNCASCHGGTGFTDSLDASQLKNIGTLKPGSGKRLGGTLVGIDIPTLRDVWASAPYLHDGSAPTLDAAVQAHNGMSLSADDLRTLTEYLRQIGSDEIAAPTAPAATSVPLPPPVSPPGMSSVVCANEGETCHVPDGAVATVTYGANGVYASREGVSGSVDCTNAVFGDPIYGVVKSCTYRLTPPPPTACADEGGTCNLPAGAVAAVKYGANGIFVSRAGVSGSVACTNAVFGDPVYGVVKSCTYQVTGPI